MVHCHGGGKVPGSNPTWLLYFPTGRNLPSLSLIRQSGIVVPWQHPKPAYVCMLRNSPISISKTFPCNLAIINIATIREGDIPGLLLLLLLYSPWYVHKIIISEI